MIIPEFNQSEKSIFLIPVFSYNFGVWSNNFRLSVEKTLRALALTDQTTAAPVLIVLSGLPGTGKSYLARRLTQRLPCVVVESDLVRKVISDSQPSYSSAESAYVHHVARAVMQRLLESGHHVISDATNLAEWHRELLYHLADKTNARLIIVQTIAPDHVVRERLQRRLENHDPVDLSDADWNVHESLKAELEPIRRAYLVVDTSQDLEPAICKILRAAQ
ncbi:MAG: AAA family ATPase [Chloroflexi bacterium]|nr:AAA family ATPase [Chloroflexota bacterium]